jgi:hypothetical protein
MLKNTSPYVTNMKAVILQIQLISKQNQIKLLFNLIKENYMENQFSFCLYYM